MTRTGTTAAFAMLLAVGCGGAEKKDDKPVEAVGGTGIPITPEPTFGSTAGHKWTQMFKGATCVVVPDADEAVRDDEMRAFAAEFQQHFFGSGSPFKRIDADALANAAKRRQQLSSLPPGSALTELANKEGVDFVVRPKLVMNVRPRSDTGRSDVDSEIIATGEVELGGSAAKAGTKVGPGTVNHNQLTNTNKKGEMKLAHARVMGKVLALKMLFDMTQQSEATLQAFIFLTFKFFSSNDKAVIRDELLPKVNGIDPDFGMKEMSAGDGSGQFTIKIMSTAPIMTLQRDIENALRDDGYKIDTTRASGDAGEQIIFIKK